MNEFVLFIAAFGSALLAGIHAAEHNWSYGRSALLSAVIGSIWFLARKALS